MADNIASPVNAGDVLDNPAQSRFELNVPTKDGVKTAIAVYRLSGDTMHFTHTETPPQLRGQGIASKLIHGALTQVKARGLKVVPRCPFVRDFIERHHGEFGDLVAG